jgi:hypothetical protein
VSKFAQKQKFGQLFSWGTILSRLFLGQRKIWEIKFGRVFFFFWEIKILKCERK